MTTDTRVSLSVLVPGILPMVAAIGSDEFLILLLLAATALLCSWRHPRRAPK